jgi:adenine-specific DNA-methyltransferase
MPKRGNSNSPKAESYRHPTAESPGRPEAGTQAQFRKRKPPATYRYDSSLAPSMDWDGRNPTRELGEWLLACIQEAALLPAPQLFEAYRAANRSTT